MIGEVDGDIMMAEVLPCGKLLIGGLPAIAAILVVQDVIKFQREAGFVPEDFPDDEAVPTEDIAVHAAEGITPTGIFDEA